MTLFKGRARPSSAFIQVLYAMKTRLAVAVKRLLSAARDARVVRKVSQHQSQPCKLVFVGAGHSGKTALVATLSGRSFPWEYDPTLFDVAEAEEADATLWDTPGTAPYDHLRPLCYSGANVILLCMALDRPDQATIDGVQRWSSELRQCCPRVPVLVVGELPD